MMEKIFLSMILLLSAATGILAQDDSDIKQWREQKLRKETSLQQAADTSAAAVELKAKVDARKEGVILEAAKTGDRSLIPYLKQLASDEDSRTRQNKAAFEAHVALAKLDDESALQEILDELKSDNLWVKGSAISKLALVGNKTAYRKLHELLDDTVNRPTGGDVYGSNSQVAMTYLGKTVENPPRLPNGNVNDTDVKVWKIWFAKNKHLIE